MLVRGLNAKKIKLNDSEFKTIRTLTGKHFAPHVESQ